MGQGGGGGRGGVKLKYERVALLGLKISQKSPENTCARVSF